MATNLSDWTPISYDPTLAAAPPNRSAILDFAQEVRMGTETMEIPRLVGGNVGMGDTLVTSGGTAGHATLYSSVFNGKDDLSEAQVEDSYVARTIAGFALLWENSLRISYDNACLGVTGARSTDTNLKRPFNSLLYTLQNSDSEVNYTGGANVISGAVTYDNLSNVLGVMENSEFGAEEQLVVIAHPGLKNSLRKVKDGDQRPIFQEHGSTIDDSTLFGLPIRWTGGATESTNYGNAGLSSANRLLFIANRNSLRAGIRIEPQFRFIPAALKTDTLAHTLQYRARLGFVAVMPQAAAVLRVTS